MRVRAQAYAMASSSRAVFLSFIFAVLLAWFCWAHHYCAVYLKHYDIIFYSFDFLFSFSVRAALLALSHLSSISKRCLIFGNELAFRGEDLGSMTRAVDGLYAERKVCIRWGVRRGWERKFDMASRIGDMLHCNCICLITKKSDWTSRPIPFYFTFIQKYMHQFCLWFCFQWYLMSHGVCLRALLCDWPFQVIQRCDWLFVVVGHDASEFAVTGQP